MNQSPRLTLGFYPGCSGLGTSVEYNSSTHEVCRHLDIELKEIPDWNCCGSTPAHSIDHLLSTSLSVRNFAQAEEDGIKDVITPCPSCLKNLRNALINIEDPGFRARVDLLTQRPLKEEHTVRSVLQVLVEDIGLEAIREKVVRPLTGLKAVCYYGCLMNRPESTMKFDSPENPVAMDRVLEALGAEVIPFPLKVQCCGAAMAIPTRNVIPRLSGKILDMAAGLGADVIVVCCPMCQMNLDLRQSQINRANKTKHKIPVPYITQLMAYAFGSGEQGIGFNKLAVDVTPALAAMAGRAVEIARKEKEAAEKAAAKAKPKEAEAPEAEAAAGGEK